MTDGAVAFSYAASADVRINLALDGFIWIFLLFFTTIKSPWSNIRTDTLGPAFYFRRPFARNQKYTHVSGAELANRLD